MIFLFLLLLFLFSELINWLGATYGTPIWWAGIVIFIGGFLWLLNRYCKIVI